MLKDAEAQVQEQFKKGDITKEQYRDFQREIIATEQRLESLKDELKDMEQYVKEDIQDENLRDEDMFRINEKIKDLEKQILNVIEG